MLYGTFKTAHSAANTVIFENSELFWIAEYYAVAADLRVDGDKWAWLNCPSPAKEAEAGSCSGE